MKNRLWPAILFLMISCTSKHKDVIAPGIQSPINENNINTNILQFDKKGGSQHILYKDSLF